MSYKQELCLARRVDQEKRSENFSVDGKSGSNVSAI